MTDHLAKEGSKLPYKDSSTFYNEVKANTAATWKVSHPAFNLKDPYYQLSRQEQVLIFRLRIKHNRLRYHLFHKFRIAQITNSPVELAVKQ